MKSMKFNSFKGMQIPSQSEILVLGGISCHQANLIVNSTCEGGDQEMCERYCSMSIQCDGNGVADPYACGNTPPP